MRPDEPDVGAAEWSDVPHAIELGLDTFGDITIGGDGRPLSTAQVLRDVVAQGVLADQVGLDFIGLGEHHRPDFSISAPEVMLAAIAAKSQRIHLGSAVTVLSSDDPVRVYERFATLHAISSGRAEVIVGRGSFHGVLSAIRLRPLALRGLFEEKLSLFAELLKQRPVTWRGNTRSALTNQPVLPPLETDTLRTWVGVGGTPASVVRAARYGFPLISRSSAAPPGVSRRSLDLYHRSLERGRSRVAADWCAFTGTRGGNRQPGEGGTLAALRGVDEPDWQRTRLAANHPKPFRAGGRS